MFKFRPSYSNIFEVIPTVIFLHGFGMLHQIRQLQFKRFSEKKLIVAFTKSTVFILYLYMSKMVWFHVLALIVSYIFLVARKSDHKYLHARQTPHQLIFLSQTTPDCIRYIIVVFCYSHKSTDEHSCFIFTVSAPTGGKMLITVPSFALLDYRVTNKIYLFATRNTSSAKLSQSECLICTA